MFDHIGGKIKTLAKVCCVLGIIGSLLSGIVIISNNSYYRPTTGVGIMVIVVGCLASWIGAFATYGFGELIETTVDNNKQLKTIESGIKQLLEKETKIIEVPVKQETAETETKMSVDAVEVPHEVFEKVDIEDGKKLYAVLEAMSSAKEIYSYLQENWGEDERVRPLIEKISETVKLERLYGNCKNTAMRNAREFLIEAPEE